ncbi:MAG: PilZ domain-containing protein [Desulfobaccales bacterium]
MPPLRRPKEDSRGKRRITTVLPMDCTVVSLPLNRSTGHHLGPGDNFGGRTINLSKTGLQVHSDYELDPKTVVDLTVTVNQPNLRPLTVRAEVAWAKRNAIDLYGRWGMGLRIIEARPGDLDALHDYYDSLTA